MGLGALLGGSCVDRIGNSDLELPYFTVLDALTDVAQHRAHSNQPVRSQLDVRSVGYAPHSPQL